MNARTRSENSTNVRTSTDPFRAPRTVLRALAPVAPRLAAAFAERLFLSVPRHERPAWEAEILAKGARGTVQTVTGDELPTWTFGEGPTVLLVHGWSGRGSQLGAFVAPLVAAGFRVVTFDGPGHGDAEARYGSVVTQARAVAAVAAAVGPVHAIVAHSVGGAASILAATWAPSTQAERYVLLAPPTSPEKFVGEFSRALALSSSVQGALIARIERRYGIALRELDVRRAAELLDAPALILHDQDDREVPISDGRSIANAWTNARLEVTSGLGHRRILRTPAVVASVVDFVLNRGLATERVRALECA